MTREPGKQKSFAEKNYPTIQFDYMYLANKNTPAIVAIDSWTRMSCVAPVAGKQVTRQGVEQGYLDEVELVGDGEEAMTARISSLEETRRGMGYPTTSNSGRPYNKSRTAKAARLIQTLRRQSICLVRSVERKCNTSIPEGHAIQAWSLVHASFLLNCFHRHVMLDTTPYESAFGRAYRGKIAPFREYVYALKKLEKKPNAQWCGGIYLSKTRNDLRIIGLEDGAMLAGAIRGTGAGWSHELGGGGVRGGAGSLHLRK